MAYIQTDAIYERLREVVQDGLGSIRRVSSQRFTGDMPEGLSEDEARRRGTTAARVEVRIVEVGPHRQRLVQTGDIQFHRVVVEFTVTRTLAIETQVSDDLRDDALALAAQDGDVIRQAVEWPHNIKQTSGGTATDLLSLMHQRTSCRVVGSAGKAQHVATVHRFEGTALSRPALNTYESGVALVLLQSDATELTLLDDATTAITTL